MVRCVELIKEKLIESFYARKNEEILEDLNQARKEVLNVYRSTDTIVVMETLIYFDKIISKTTGIKDKPQLALYRGFMKLMNYNSMDNQVISVILSRVYSQRLFLSRVFGSIRESRNIVNGYNKCMEPGRFRFLEKIAEDGILMNKLYFDRYILRHEPENKEMIYLEEGKLTLQNFNDSRLDLLFHITKCSKIFSSI